METETEKTEKLIDIRAAIVGPDRTIGSGIPGYYCIFCYNNKKLVFIKEDEEISIAGLFGKLLADEEQYRFHTLYLEPFEFTDVPDFIRDLNSLSEKTFSWIRTIPTSYFYGADPAQGVNIIAQWADRFSPIPKGTTLRYHFDNLNLNREKYDDPNFYAFTALRYLVAGFKLDKSSFIKGVAENRARAKIKKSRKKLTGAARAAADELDYFLRRLKDEDDWEDDY